MGLSKGAINGQCFFSRGSSADSRFAFRHRTIVGHYVVVVCQADVGLGIIRISLNGLVEIFFGLFQRLRSALAPVIAAFQIELVSLGIVGAAFGNFSLGFGRQPFAQLGGDGAGDVLLHRQQIRHLAVVLVSTQIVVG